MALTLRAVGGLTTAEIARAFLVPEATMAQRISRAKQRIRASGARFRPPPDAEWADRLAVVLHVLYLVFNEGYSATSGPDLQRPDLTAEAIRLTRAVHRALPGDGEVAGLLALMLLTDARRPARTDPDGNLVPLAEQDRSLWDRAAIDEGVELITATLATARLGPYQLQAAIAAVHDEAASDEETDWPQVLALYDLLARLWPSPMVTLNQAVAVAMVRGPQAGLDHLAALEADDRMADHHRLHAVRAHLLEMAGDPEAARAGYREAARRTTSRAERRYLELCASRITPRATIERDEHQRHVGRDPGHDLLGHLEQHRLVLVDVDGHRVLLAPDQAGEPFGQPGAAGQEVVVEQRGRGGGQRQQHAAHEREHPGVDVAVAVEGGPGGDGQDDGDGDGQPEAPGGRVERPVQPGADGRPALPQVEGMEPEHDRPAEVGEHEAEERQADPRHRVPVEAAHQATDAAGGHGG